MLDVSTTPINVGISSERHENLRDADFSSRESMGDNSPDRLGKLLHVHVIIIQYWSIAPIQCSEYSYQPANC